jgi:SAM-dependent methyltransferase
MPDLAHHAVTIGEEPTRSHLIEWTGERCVPWAPDHQVVYEHMHRYNFAASYCAGKRVLDLASGEGYGSAILGNTASEVIGLDIDGPSVEHARVMYGCDTVHFIEGSMIDPDIFTDKSFDVVVCFEALEHTDDHDLLLRVIVGALRPEGLVFISTPDRTIYSELHGHHNPFHVHELDREEFRDLLARHFRHAVLLTQEVATGSVMQALDPSQSGELIRVSGDDGWKVQLGTPPYLVALASDAPLPPIPSVAALIDTDMLLMRRSPAVAQLEESLARLDSELAVREVDVARWHLAATDAEAQVVSLKAETSRQDAQIEHLEGSVRGLMEEIQLARVVAEDVATTTNLRWEIDSIKATRGWRALEKMRRSYRRVRRLGRPLRRLPPFRRPPS